MQLLERFTTRHPHTYSHGILVSKNSKTLRAKELAQLLKGDNRGFVKEKYRLGLLPIPQQLYFFLHCSLDN